MVPVPAENGNFYNDESPDRISSGVCRCTLIVDPLYAKLRADERGFVLVYAVGIDPFKARQAFLGAEPEIIAVRDDSVDLDR